MNSKRELAMAADMWACDMLKSIGFTRPEVAYPTLHDRLLAVAMAAAVGGEKEFKVMKAAVDAMVDLGYHTPS